MTVSTYVKTDGKTRIEQYPYSLGQIISENPNVSFALPITDEAAAAYDVFPVEDTPQPDYNPMTENLAMGDPVFESGKWVQTWSVTTVSPEERQERLLAWRSTLTCSPLQGKIELDNQGRLDDAEEIVAAADRITQLAWNNATIWLRTSPMIENIGAQLELSPTDLDNLFQAAQSIVV